MHSALYISKTGLSAQDTSLKTISNNLANVDSPGYKSDSPFYRMLQQSFGKLSGSAVAGTVTDHAAGTLRNTGNPLDLAINGEGFFTVRTPAGVGYTRNGSFSLSPAGELVTQNGNQVLDPQGQPILLTLDPQMSNEVFINRNGDITVDETIVGRINIVNFADNTALTKLSDQIFTTNQQPQQVINPAVEQGFLEQSNASAIESMLQLVNLQRMFDMNSKTVNTVMNQINRSAITGIVSG